MMGALPDLNEFIELKGVSKEKLDEQKSKIIKMRNQALMKSASSKDPDLRQRYEKVLYERQMRAELKRIAMGDYSNIQIFKSFLMDDGQGMYFNGQLELKPKRKKKKRRRAKKNSFNEEKEESNPLPYGVGSVANPFVKQRSLPAASRTQSPSPHNPSTLPPPPHLQTLTTSVEARHTSPAGMGIPLPTRSGVVKLPLSTDSENLKYTDDVSHYSESHEDSDHYDPEKT